MRAWAAIIDKEKKSKSDANTWYSIPTNLKNRLTCMVRFGEIVGLREGSGMGVVTGVGTKVGADVGAGVGYLVGFFVGIDVGFLVGCNMCKRQRIRIGRGDNNRHNKICTSTLTGGGALGSRGIVLVNVRCPPSIFWASPAKRRYQSEGNV